jgi:hypothetical protein
MQLNTVCACWQVPLKQFFGPYIPPENLTEAAANDLLPGSYGQAIAKGTIVGDAISNMAIEVGAFHLACIGLLCTGRCPVHQLTWGDGGRNPSPSPRKGQQVVKLAR